MPHLKDRIAPRNNHRPRRSRQGLKRGPKPRPIVDFPEPLSCDERDPPTFPEALSLQMSRHGESCWHLHRSIVRPGESFNRKTLHDWAAGRKTPNSLIGFEMLTRIEHRYRLPEGHFRAKLDIVGRAPRRHELGALSAAERRRLSWHLPGNFDRRPAAEQAEILEWVRTVVISGSTDFRRYQMEAMKVRFALKFPPLASLRRHREFADDEALRTITDGTRAAPPGLVRELADLVRFKMATLTEIGVQRNGVWNEETAAQKIEHLALLFGALSADAASPVRGAGVAVDRLSLALLAFPSVWDWYLQWREARRGFFSSWELNMISLGLSLVRQGTGWLRQNPQLLENLRPISGLLAEQDIDAARADWDATCDAAHRHSLARIKEIGRVARVHRDPFEPILPILEDQSPLGAYRRITHEILRHMPDRRRYPRGAAESVRGFLMLRFALHLGVRQKNLRELLLCQRGSLPRTDRQLEALRRGELRWNTKERGWEVVIPSNAFKNSNSSFFGRKPFRLLLPDLDGLYGHVDAYIAELRPWLLKGAPDPGTFFVKTVKRTSRDASYSQAAFYEAWRLIIQRYGIHNPYTGRGAIKGLLPHGPHNVRDVLATHVLKHTGSYEQAGYAIQDTPEMVAKHYGRFLPQDKSALAARVLNRAWED